MARIGTVLSQSFRVCGVQQSEESGRWRLKGIQLCSVEQGK
jgi:hypothetical protein